jgi:hypothetical protein
MPNESADRVRENSPQAVNASIDRGIEERVLQAAQENAFEILHRIEELDREWDIEQALELNAATLGVSGLMLGALFDRRWLIVPGIVLPFLIQHAVQGWCPPMVLLRRMGFRSRNEIDRERYALKALRGDFEGVSPQEELNQFARAERALRAVKG